MPVTVPGGDGLELASSDFSTPPRFPANDALLASIIHFSDDAIISKNLDSIITSWNRGAERLFGYSAEEVIGRSVTLLIPGDRHDEEPMILDRLRRGQPIDHYETVRRRKDGSLVDVSLCVSPVRNASNEIVGASKIARDISDRKRHERLLVDTDRRKNEFLATLAHELRNPLAPLRNCVLTLQLTEQDNPFLSELTAIMGRQIDQLVRLVDDLLEVSRINVGKVELRLAKTDLCEVIRTAYETCQPVIQAAGHSFCVEIPPTPLTVHGDSARLTQIVANLLNNAAKYTPRAGSIKLRLYKQNDLAAISVSDTGIGLSPEDLNRVFEIFAQVGNNPNRLQDGLGIGLSLAKSLTELHGGRIRARSEGHGRGSEFIVELPLFMPDRDDSGSEQPAEFDGTSLPNTKILVVDDSQDAANALCHYLTSIGANACLAIGAEEALSRFSHVVPEVVLIDLQMPGIDGFELARRLRQTESPTRPLLIAVSGWAQEQHRQQSAAAGFDDHLSKPADIGRLKSLILRHVMNRSRVH